MLDTLSKPNGLPAKIVGLEMGPAPSKQGPPLRRVQPRGFGNECGLAGNAGRRTINVYGRLQHVPHDGLLPPTGLRTIAPAWL
jgi:hypothetical protein